MKKADILRFLSSEIKSKWAPHYRDRITVNTDLRKDFGLDSLDLVELRLNIEDTFDISFPNEKILTVKTVGDLIDLILDYYIP